MIIPTLNYYKLTLFFLISHLPFFLLVRSSWYAKLIPSTLLTVWADVLHSLPFVTHYLLDSFFCMFYIFVGCFLSYNLRLNYATSLLNSPFITNLIYIVLVTLSFNSIIGLVLRCCSPQATFLTCFFPILFSDLIAITTIFSLSYLLNFLVG